MESPTRRNRQALVAIIILFMSLVMLAVAPTRQNALAGPAGADALALALTSVPGQAQGKQSQPQAAVGSTFTYQGQLKDGGNPANGQYDFTFKLYDASSGGTQVGSTLTMSNQTVSSGLFTVQLDFGATAYQGDGRWMEIAVRVAGGPTYTTLSPRQALTATPYAASLMPGASIRSNTTTPALIGVSNGIGLEGASSASYGVYGTSTSSTGVFGESSSTNVSDGGVRGVNSASSGGTGVRGIADLGFGVYGSSTISAGVYGSSISGAGVYGLSSSFYGVYGSSSNSDGVHGLSSSSSGVYGSSSTSSGVYGQSTSGSGVYGSSSSYYGVYGLSTGNWGIAGTGTSGVWGNATSTNGYGVSGTTAGGAAVAGVAGTSTGANSTGVHGTANNGTLAYGVWGESTNGYGVTGTSGSNWGIKGAGASGVWGVANASNGTGVSGQSSGGYGIYGVSTTSYAGWFQGNVRITGTCCAMGEAYTQIDNPLNPENKYLNQALVQSPDMLTTINGNVTTDAKGDAVVTLPDWFQAANKDFRYQLTIMGDQFAQSRVASKLQNNSFTIKTDKPNIEVSWQVTGVRSDPYAEAHPVNVEAAKPADEKGKYLHPTEYGQPESQGIGYDRNPLAHPQPDMKPDVQSKVKP